MIAELMDDIRCRPDLFHFTGALPKRELEAWIAKNRYSIPDDLWELWSGLGGGEMFETETVLSPLGNAALGDDVDSVNSFHRARGLSPQKLIFHVGIGSLSVVELGVGRYASVSD